jgi:hypothetical protein
MLITEKPGHYEGEVLIAWTQLMPRGSFGNWMSMLAIGTSAVIGAAVALYNWGLDSLLVGFATGGFAGAWVAGAGLKNTEQERAIAQRPIPRRVRAQGGIVWQPFAEAFYLAWEFTTPGGQRIYHAINIDAFETFETRTSNEWMVGQHARGDYHDCNVILVDHPDYGPVVVAAHIGPLAELAQLHAVLSNHILNARLMAKKRRTRVIATVESAPDSRDDLPAAL